MLAGQVLKLGYLVYLSRVKVALQVAAVVMMLGLAVFSSNKDTLR